AGTFTGTVRWCLSRPLPRHLGHGSVMMRPSPRHFGHAVILVKRPKTLDLTCLIWPLPLQAEQRSGEVPVLLRVPWHSVQYSFRTTVTSFSQPKAASSSVRLTFTCRVVPFSGA